MPSGDDRSLFGFSRSVHLHRVDVSFVVFRTAGDRHDQRSVTHDRGEFRSRGPVLVGVVSGERAGPASLSHPFASDDIATCPTILEFDPSALVLTAYNRINGGTVRGDPELAANFRSLFVSI